MKAIFLFLRSISFLFDWGNETLSYWLDPFDTEDVIFVSHIWDSSGSFDEIDKAKDFHGLESEGSDPIEIIIPKWDSQANVWWDQAPCKFFDKVLNLVLHFDPGSTGFIPHIFIMRLMRIPGG